MRKLFTIYNLELGFCIIALAALPITLLYVLYKALGIYILMIPATLFVFMTVGFVYNLLRSVKKSDLND